MPDTKLARRRDRDEPSLPRGYWASSRVRELLDETLMPSIDVELEGLAPEERATIEHLLDAGIVSQDLSEDQEHRQALAAKRRLTELHESLGRPARTEDLLLLYEISQGPIATTLENQLLPFLPVDEFAPGRNVYPWQIEAGELNAFLDTRPDLRDTLLGRLSVVRRTTPAMLRRDLTVVRRHAVLADLHPGLRADLERLHESPASQAFYAVPYSVAWPRETLAISAHLVAAADAVAPVDRDFEAFLRLRARDLLADDTEGGDAAWIRGSFGNLDAVIGPYESYDDDLFGAKRFFGLSILVRDPKGTAEIREGLRHLQEIQDSLPGSGREVRTPPVGSYDLVAAFGQGRGVSAEILPNDPDLIRKYGRKVLIRRNASLKPERFERAAARWRSAVAPEQHADLTAEGAYEQVVWHEIGHYLGPDTTADGRPIQETLGEDAALLEELKAELVSAAAAEWLLDAGLIDRRAFIERTAALVFAGLRPVRPIRSQPYPTLWLMIFNALVDGGAITFHPAGLRVDHDVARKVFSGLLAETIRLQEHGRRAESNALIERYSGWDERHEALAARIRASQGHHFVVDRYPVLDGRPRPGDR